MSPLHHHVVTGAVRVLPSLRTLIQRVVILFQHSSPHSPPIMPTPSPSSFFFCSSHNNDHHHCSQSVLQELIETYTGGMSRSELLFFVCIAISIGLFGIVLPLWEALSTCSSKTSSKNKKKLVWYDDNDDDDEEDFSELDSPSNDDIIVGGPCRLKAYVPGMGVVLLSDTNHNYCSVSSSSSSSTGSLSSQSSRSSVCCWNRNNCIPRRGSSVGSNDSYSSCGSWCMDTIEESEEEEVDEEEDSS